MCPCDDRQDRLLQAGQRVQMPERHQNPGIGVIQPVDFMQAAVGQNMEHDQRWNCDPARVLQHVGPAESAPGPSPVGRDHHRDRVGDQGAVQQCRAHPGSPDKQKRLTPKIHRMHRDDSQRMIHQVRGDKGKQDQSRVQPYPADQVHIPRLGLIDAPWECGFCAAVRPRFRRSRGTAHVSLPRRTASVPP